MALMGYSKARYINNHAFPTHISIIFVVMSIKRHNHKIQTDTLINISTETGRWIEKISLQQPGVLYVNVIALQTILLLVAYYYIIRYSLHVILCDKVHILKLVLARFRSTIDILNENR